VYRLAFSQDSAPDPTWGAYSAPPYPLASRPIKGPTCKERGDEWKERDRGGRVNGRRERRGGSETVNTPSINS